VSLNVFCLKFLHCKTVYIIKIQRPVGYDKKDEKEQEARRALTSLVGELK
jgi:hypothetical protein